MLTGKGQRRRGWEAWRRHHLTSSGDSLTPGCGGAGWEPLPTASCHRPGSCARGPRGPRLAWVRTAAEGSMGSPCLPVQGGHRAGRGLGVSQTSVWPAHHTSPCSLHLLPCFSNLPSRAQHWAFARVLPTAPYSPVGAPSNLRSRLPYCLLPEARPDCCALTPSVWFPQSTHHRLTSSSYCLCPFPPKWVTTMGTTLVLLTAAVPELGPGPGPQQVFRKCAESLDEPTGPPHSAHRCHTSASLRAPRTPVKGTSKPPRWGAQEPAL